MSAQSSEDLPTPESQKEPPHDDSLSQTPARQASAPATSAEKEEQPAPDPKQPSTLKQIWTKIGLDKPTIFTMLKGGVAPIICLAFYQATPVADTFTTLGYLVAIASLLSMPILPRAKFIENMILNVFTICLSAAVSVLANWTAQQARLHTQGPQPSVYNSSQAAVCAIWLMFQIFLINYFRSARPQYVFPGKPGNFHGL